MQRTLSSLNTWILVHGMLEVSEINVTTACYFSRYNCFFFAFRRFCKHLSLYFEADIFERPHAQFAIGPLETSQLKSKAYFVGHN